MPDAQGFRYRWLRYSVWVPYAWLLLFFLAPFFIVLKISLAEPVVALPPFTPLLVETAEGTQVQATVDNYRFVFQDDYYPTIYLSSVRTAAIATFFCLLLGYPMAWVMARARQPWRSLLLLGVVVPFWISFLLRVYAWIGLLNTKGVINSALMSAGVIDQPLPLIYNDFANYVGLVYSYLPFMILPLYASLTRLDESVLEAAADLGARPWRVFVDVIWPLSLPGVIGGCLLVFIPAIGEFVIPALLGGADTLMIGRALWDEFFIARDWPVASAVAIMLLLILVAPMLWFQRIEDRDEPIEAAK